VISVACEKETAEDVFSVKTEDLYGAWFYEGEPSKIMLCMENNQVYTGACPENAFVLITLSETDTVVAFQGSYSVRNAILFSGEGLDTTSSYSNRIYAFFKDSLVLHSDNVADKKAKYIRISSEFEQTPPK